MIHRISASDPNALSLAATVIRNGGVVVYPTDTLYGFGVDATNEKAISKLNTIKGRSGPVSVIASTKEEAFRWFNLSKDDLKLAGTVLGGKTTLIAPVKPDIVHPMILGEEHSLGIRIPDHAFSPNLVEQLGRPITTTSVNRQGQTPLQNPDVIEKAFSNEMDLLIDDGVFMEVQGSKIYKIENSKLIRLR